MTSRYIVEDADSGLRNLNDLIDVACDLHFEGTPEPGDTRLGTLLWVIRDLSEGLVRLADQDAPASAATDPEKSREAIS